VRDWRRGRRLRNWRVCSDWRWLAQRSGLGRGADIHVLSSTRLDDLYVHGIFRLQDDSIETSLDAAPEGCPRFFIGVMARTGHDPQNAVWYLLYVLRRELIIVALFV